MSKLHFVTFAGTYTKDLQDPYYAAKERILLQAQQTQIFDSVYGFDNFDLDKDIKFKIQHTDFINNNKRGYGYWLWKPYIILKTLLQLPLGHVLLYADAGANIITHYPKEKHLKHKEFLYENAKKYTILTVRHRFDILKQWIKNDVILKYNITNDFLNTRIVEANRILIHNTVQSQQFIHSWYNMCCNYRDIDDSPSHTESPFDFCEHRHDQSLLNCLIDIEARNYNIFASEDIKRNNHPSINCNYLRRIVEVIRWPKHRTGISYFCFNRTKCVCNCCC